MWTIKHIFDGEYGCEELAEGQRPRVSVTLVDESGQEIRKSVEDDWLRERGLDVGSVWPAAEKSEEILDVVDENGNPTGETVARAYAHAHGIWHRTSHVWILRKKNREIEILLQKRAPNKSFPECLDISSAGHIPAGVDFLPSAIRELYEELGVTAEEKDLIFCGDMTKIWDDTFNGKPLHDRQYYRVFCMWLDQEEKDFTLQEEEVEKVVWMKLSECIEKVKNNTIRHCIIPSELELVQRTIQN